MAAWEDAPIVGDAEKPLKAVVSGASWESAPIVADSPKRRATDEKAGPEKPYGSPLASVGEPALNMATGMVAKPASDVVGLAALGLEGARRAGLPIPERDPLAIQRQVQNAFTYQPRTQVGEAVTEYNPLALFGKGVNWLGQQAEAGINQIPMNVPLRNMLGYAAHEIVNQAPMFAGLKAPEAAAATSNALGSGARWSMGKTLKPTVEEWQTGKADKAIDTMLNGPARGTNPTVGGAETIRDRISELNNEIKQKIANSPVVLSQPGIMAQVNRQMNGLLDKFYKQASYTTDVAAIQKAWDEVVNHPLLQGLDIPVQVAQEIKQGTYRSLGDKAYPGGQVAGGKAAEKEVARIMKEEVANAVPEVRPLNAEESQLLNLLPMVERRAFREASNNLGGLGWLTHNPKMFVAYMADKSSLFKSLVARMLNVGSEAIPQMNVAGPASGMVTTDQADRQKALVQP